MFGSLEISDLVASGIGSSTMSPLQRPHLKFLPMSDVSNEIGLLPIILTSEFQLPPGMQFTADRHAPHATRDAV
jgi:hypothetical protein